MIAFLYMAAMPYLIFGALKFILFKIHWSSLWLLLFMLLAACVILSSIGSFFNVIFNLGCLRKGKIRSNAVKLLIVKGAYLPVYHSLKYMMYAFANPWFMMALWIPPLCFVLLAIFSGFTALGLCISLVRKKCCRVWTAVLLGLMSFVPIADIIALVIIFIIGGGKKLESTNNF